METAPSSGESWPSRAVRRRAPGDYQPVGSHLSFCRKHITGPETPGRSGTLFQMLGLFCLSFRCDFLSGDARPCSSISPRLVITQCAPWYSHYRALRPMPKLWSIFETLRSPRCGVCVIWVSDWPRAPIESHSSASHTNYLRSRHFFVIASFSFVMLDL